MGPGPSGLLKGCQKQRRKRKGKEEREKRKIEEKKGERKEETKKGKDRKVNQYNERAPLRGGFKATDLVFYTARICRVW